MKNKLIADLFSKIADLLDIQGVAFKPRAYRLAAQTIESYPDDLETLYKNDGIKGLEALPGIGKNLAEKIIEILETGKLSYYDQLKRELPISPDLIDIEGIGPKRAKLLYDHLHIKTLRDLEKAARTHRLEKLLGRKIADNILYAITIKKATPHRFLLGYILQDVEHIKDQLANLPDVEDIAICGSIRRRKETIGDADLLVSSTHPKPIMHAFTTLPDVKDIIAEGPTKSTIRLSNNLKIDLRVVPKESYGAALQYFTGNQIHNIQLRKIAITKKLKLNEYGVYKGSKNIAAGDDEAKVYKALGLAYIEPELREDYGEIDAAKRKALPNLVHYNDIQGDVHMHTNLTDGTATIEAMANAAQQLGRKYIAITEHTQALGIAHGLNDRQVLNHIARVQKLQKKYKNLTILSGVELNIQSDGTPDIRNDVLKRLDIVVGSIHSGFKDTEDKMTNRILTAMNNKNIDFIGHPTGRLIQAREPYHVNLFKIYARARETGTALEINSFPERLDLKDTDIHEAIKQKVKLIINSDAHATRHLEFIQYGVYQARRGWAEKKDILNTLPVDSFLKKLK